jgi:ornithine carbamoyltransferase
MAVGDPAADRRSPVARGEDHRSFRVEPPAKWVEPAGRRLLKERDVPLLALEHAHELVEQRAPGSRADGVSPVEQVPAERTNYDAWVTRHFLTGEELTAEELSDLLDRADFLKADRWASAQLTGRSVALVFERPSTRTRISFEVGVRELGGNPLVLREGEMQLSRGESPRDTALVLSRYVHAIAVRTGAHSLLEELAEHASVPVINMLTADHHPCQALADLQTIRERFGTLEGIKLAYVGDGNNVAHSLMLLGGVAGMEVVVACPEELSPDPAVVARSGGAVVTHDAAEAVAGAHALYTDVWVSMGDEAEADRRRSLLGPYQVNEELLARARPEAIVLHCLPAHVDEEVTEGVLYGPQSAVFDEAENRLHAQKALLEMLVAAPAPNLPASG